MEEHATGKTRYLKFVGCPACGKQLTLELQLSKIGGDLYVWFEGMCGDCCHKIVDPLPKTDFDFVHLVERISLN
ncbi:MAG: hypothetical protein FJZ95_09000 [Chloroflexi bacterium]|nr:hypothetical protein [Chloroflexota bacterium]